MRHRANSLVSSEASRRWTASNGKEYRWRGDQVRTLGTADITAHLSYDQLYDFSSTPPIRIARYSSTGLFNFVHQKIVVYEEGEEIIDGIVVSCILMQVYYQKISPYVHHALV
jgi:hypothetical protein